MNKSKQVIVTIVVLLIATGQMVRAVTTTFTNPAGGDWNAPANWNAGVPTLGKTGLLNSVTGNYSVIYSNPAASGPWSMVISNTAGNTTTLDINASGFATSDPASNFAVVISRGRVNVNPGGVWNAGDGHLVMDAGSVLSVQGGTVTKTGSGDVSPGHLITGPTGTITVASGLFDATGIRVNVGHFSQGFLNIYGGETRIGFLRLSESATANGKMTMTNGLLRITNGGFDFSVGQAGNAQFDMSGGVITNVGELRVVTQATKTTGTVTQTGGTIVQLGHVFLSSTTGSTNNRSTYTLSGSGTLIVTNAAHSLQLNVGNTTTGVGIFNKTGGTLLVDNLTVNSAGYLTSSGGQTWTVYGSVSNNSTQNTLFDLRGATLTLAGGTAHNLTVAGADLGVNLLGYNNNFALDALSLGTATDTLALSDANGGGGAIYLNTLLLPGNNTNLLANITSPSGLNIYYRSDDSRSAYLLGLTYDLMGGGDLIPLSIPEPSTLSFGIVGALALRAWRRRRTPAH